MKIGIIQAQLMSIHDIYYFYGLSLIKDLQVVSNYKLLDSTIIGSIEEIENDNSLDYVLYDWNYIYKENKNPVAKAKIITFMSGDKVYWSFKQDFLDKSFLCFKSSCPKDKDILKYDFNRPFPFNNKCDNLSNENLDKIKPLMYVVNQGLNEIKTLCNDGINMNFPLYPFTREIIISFIGSITSWNRIQTVKILREKFNNYFYGGFVKDTRGKESSFDEDGKNIAGIDVSQYQFKFGINYQDFIQLTKKSIINLSPAGWGANTHRRTEILCSGGFCLSCDVSHIDYGTFSPEDGIHYISYKNDMTDFVDKVEYFKNNPGKAEEIGNAARKFMENTYLKPEVMAREYIMKYLI